MCNHTYFHRSMTGISREEFNTELTRLESACVNTVGYSLDRFYRPPEGKFDRNSLQYAKELGYKTIFWSFAYEDWDNSKQPNSDYAIRKVLENTHNGGVFLFHPTSRTNAKIFPTLIDSWRGMGYSFGTLDELVRE